MPTTPVASVGDLSPGTFVLLSSLDRVLEVLVVKSHVTERFIADAEPVVRGAGAELVAIEVPDGVACDRWMQDTVELGCVVTGGGGGSRVEAAALLGLRAGHQGVNAGPLDRHMRTYLEGRGVRCFEPGEPRVASDWIDWYGNLEVSPPCVDSDGRAFPYGRVLTGDQGGRTMHPGVMEFLARQDVQTPPLVVDTSWLQIGHVDEVVNFVPADTARGYMAIMPSPTGAELILKSLSASAHGDAVCFESRSDRATVDELLSDEDLRTENHRIAQALDATTDQLCEGLGLEPPDILELPCLFRHGGALIPNVVNSLICNGQVLAPAPEGPVVDGCDVFAAAIDRALGTARVQVHMLDAWDTFHRASGEIHCGTNAIRRPQWAE